MFSWRLRAGRFVGSVTRRRGGPPAHRPSGRGPGCGFASDRAIPPPSQAGVGFGLWLGSPVWFCCSLGQREIKLRRHQGPTDGGVPTAAACAVVVVVLRNKNPLTPCLWQAPASTQKTKRKTRPAIRRSARWRVIDLGVWTATPPVEVWFFCNNFFRGNFVLKKPRGSHQLRLGIRPPARLGGAMRRSSANPLPGPLPLGR